MKKFHTDSYSDSAQTWMFDDEQVTRPIQTGLTVDLAASQAAVSTATIRNWMKAEYLQQDQLGRVEITSFQNFLSKVAGQEKLTGRANKSCKDGHDHDRLTLNFCARIDENTTDGSNLATEYEFSLSDSFKNKEGIYYTPSHIVSNLLRCDGTDKSAMTFLDPCCGSGNFLLRAIELGFKPENVYGYDTDLVATELAQKRIFEATGYKSKNITHGDFLTASLKTTIQKFDCIYTNPPWGKKISKEDKEKYSLLLQTGKSTDTCSLFFFACLNYLNKNGELGLLLPDSFFNIATFESARTKMLTLEVARLIDYGKPFKGLMTKAFAFVLKNKKPNITSHTIDCMSNDVNYQRTALSFLSNPKSIINFQANNDFENLLKHVLTFPYVTLAGQANWGLGIVTGNNDKFVKAIAYPGYMPVYRGADVKKNALLEPSCFIPKDLTLYQQVAPLEFYEAEEKLIYKFISSRLCFFYDTKKRYLLNSANLMIPYKHFPLSMPQLCDMLNSEFFNWLFLNIFQTHKILKSDLESLPIYGDYFIKNKKFEECSFLQYLSLEKCNNGTYRVKK